MNTDKRMILLEAELTKKDNKIKELKKKLANATLSEEFQKVIFNEHLENIKQVLAEAEEAKKNLDESRSLTEIAKSNYERELIKVKKMQLEYQKKYKTFESRFLNLIKNK